MRKETSYGIIPIRFKDGSWEVFLVQHTKGHWSLPKGHQEKGEEPYHTACRELYEETGLEVTNLLNEEIYYEHYKFKVKDDLIDKTVGYFLAEVGGKEKIDQDELKTGSWFKFNEAFEIVTYHQMKILLQNIQELLKKKHNES